MDFETSLHSAEGQKHLEQLAGQSTTVTSVTDGRHFSRPTMPASHPRLSAAAQSTECSWTWSLRGNFKSEFLIGRAAEAKPLAIGPSVRIRNIQHINTRSSTTLIFTFNTQTAVQPGSSHFQCRRLTGFPVPQDVPVAGHKPLVHNHKKKQTKQIWDFPLETWSCPHLMTSLSRRLSPCRPGQSPAPVV